jgi:hypothetical protein
MIEPLPSALQDPVATGFVDTVINSWCGDLGFAPGTLAALGATSIGLVDILPIIRNGTTTSLEKDDAHETLFDRFGEMDCGTQLCVTLSYCPQRQTLTLVGFMSF